VDAGTTELVTLGVLSSHRSSLPHPSRLRQVWQLSFEANCVERAPARAVQGEVRLAGRRRDLIVVLRCEFSHARDPRAPPDRPGPLRRGHGGLRQRRLSTRAVDDLVAAMGIDTGISKSEISRICTGLDERVAAFRNRTPRSRRVPLHRGAGYRRRIARSGTNNMVLG
jgi:hypothetical protein